MKHIQTGAKRAITQRTIICGGLLLAGAGFFSTSTFAACSFTGASAVTQTVDLGVHRIATSMAVGATIASITVSPTGKGIASCTSGPYSRDFLLPYAKGAGSNHIYPTNIPGVGIRVYYIGWSSYYDNPKSSLSATGPVGLYDLGGQTVELVKTGPVTPGAFSLGTLAQQFVTGISSAIYTLNVTGGSIQTYGCTVTNNDITIQLGDHKPAEFTGVGYGSAWTNFDIPLQCDASTRVFFRVDATQDPSGSGVMKLDSGSNVATGLGVQLFYNNGGPVAFSQSTEYKTSAGGTDAVKLAARYYQTASAVTAGNANATATFTLTYQ